MRPYQVPVLTSQAIDDVTISAPQLGKTFTAGMWLFCAAARHGRDPKGRVWWWTAPTYQQAVHGFRNLVSFGRNAGMVARVTATPPMELELTNGAVIQARSWERAENMYGPTVLGGVSDEFGLMTAEAYGAISSRRAETITEGFGNWRWIGNVGEIGGEAESLWNQAWEGGAGFAARRWCWRDRAAAHPCECAANGSPRAIPPDLATADDHRPDCPRGIYTRFVSREASRMSSPQFRQLYDAEWADWNLLPVYEFDRAVHVREDLAFQASLPLEVSCDFNVDPMCWVLGQHHGDESYDFDEIMIPGGATTTDACAEVLRRYPDRRTPVVVYGDASGRARDTRSKTTDYQTIQQILGGHYLSFRMNVPSRNPAVVARVNAVNARHRSADGQVRHFTHPRCKQLIADRARVSWKPGTRDIDKKNKNLTHASDASDYRLAALYPVTPAGEAVVGTPDNYRPDPDSMMGVQF